MTTVKSSSPSAAAGGGRARAIEVNCMTLADKIQHILNGDASGVLISDEYTIRKEQVAIKCTPFPIVYILLWPEYNYHYLEMINSSSVIS